jgi:murein L,D-transpeptidase YcbB/YkuD
MRIAFIGLAVSLALAGCVRPSAPVPAPDRAIPLWSAAALNDLKRTAQAAPLEGLASEQAALTEIARFQHLAATNPTASTQVDVAADDLFSSLARSFAQGGAEPARADPEWRIPPPPAPDLDALHAALAAGAMPSALLRNLLPKNADYRALRAALARTYAEAPGALDANGLDRETRLVRLRANMERWRWLPRDLPARRLEVRIPQFETMLLRPDASSIIHPVIVGARRTQTPSFAANIVSVTLNPTWEPPASIVRNELLPHFRRDPAAAENQGFDLLDSSGAVVDPAAVDWTAQPFPYHLRQRAGPGNALGQIRFDLPNPYSIYLHDTSNRALFARSDRALSHGCIRVSDPQSLAQAIIDAPEWDGAALQTAIADGETRSIALSAPVPIYVLYLTASAGEDGSVSYFDDLYHRDAAVVAALDAPDVALVAAAQTSMERCAA